MTSFYQKQIEDNYFQSPELKKKFLQLKSNKYVDIDQIEPIILKKPKLLGKKDFFQSVALDFYSFGVSWTRMEGEALFLTDSIVKEFHQAYPKWKSVSYEDLRKTLELLQESHLIAGDSIEGYWFEKPDLTKDFQKVLILANEQGLLQKTDVINAHSWTEEKTDRIFNLLQDQEILIQDNEKSDHYWLLTSD